MVDKGQVTDDIEAGIVDRSDESSHDTAPHNHGSSIGHHVARVHGFLFRSLCINYALLSRLQSTLREYFQYFFVTSLILFVCMSGCFSQLCQKSPQKFKSNEA